MTHLSFPNSTSPGTSAKCLRPGCQNPSYNGQFGEYCSRSCRAGLASSRARAVSHCGVQRHRQVHGSRGRASSPQQLRHHGFPPSPLQDISPLQFESPHEPGRTFKLLAFYFPGRDDPCDERCKAGFLGNFWDRESDKLKLRSAHSLYDREFRTAEGAYQALKFWNCFESRAFEDASGDRAFLLSRQLNEQGRVPDPTFAGYGTDFQAMRAVIRAKFAEGSRLADALKRTGDCFLLEHNSVQGRDSKWSDNQNGSGKNWLGLLLMLRRSELCNDLRSRGDGGWASGDGGRGSWLKLLHFEFDDKTGQPMLPQLWSEVVRQAASVVNKELGTTYSYSGEIGRDLLLAGAAPSTPRVDFATGVLSRRQLLECPLLRPRHHGLGMRCVAQALPDR
eukprot:gb/GFBE01031543.1/.p1 GENE.gb/GFBE01031543.1/~~gb/GFBE01031543.1/.p1  ORF type:complete len:392 (+),score=38.22 gb/GFBE01031543.1/:1-1176(+)